MEIFQSMIAVDSFPVLKTDIRYSKTHLNINIYDITLNNMLSNMREVRNTNEFSTKSGREAFVKFIVYSSKLHASLNVFQKEQSLLTPVFLCRISLTIASIVRSRSS